MNEAKISSTISGTRLYGPRLWLARLGWAIVFFLVLAMLSELMPDNRAMTYGEWYITQVRPALPGFISYRSFVNYLTILESAVAMLTLAAGLFVFRHRSDDWMGLLVSMTLVLLSLLAISGNADVWRFPAWLDWLNPFSRFLVLLTIGSFLLFFFLFPNGRFRPRWAGWLALIGFLAIAVYTISPLLLPEETRAQTSEADEELGWLIFIITLVTSFFLAVAAQVYRYRTTTDSIHRQQMKWVIFGLGAWLSGIVWQWLAALILPAGWQALIGSQFDLLALALVPISLVLSMFRYRLWDVDVILNRALVYGALTTLIIAMYALIVGALSLLFRPEENRLLSVVVTGLIAILFNPMRQRLQQGVNRLMYGERDDPVAVLSRLGEQLQNSATPTDTLPTLVETVAQALRLPYAAIALRDGEAFPIVAEYIPVPAQEGREVQVFPLVYQSEPVGQLLVAPRTNGEAFNPADRRLLDDIARQAGPAAHAALLTDQLQRSRQRLVTAREEERRRLRRDLHDDLGPQLATLALKVDTARNQLNGDPQATEQTLKELKDQIQHAIQDIRRLVYELRPPALDQLGLVPAIQQFVEAQNRHQGPRFTLQAPETLPALPAAVEVAAYRITLEAITNITRHAHARRGTVRLALEEGLLLEVCDDGHGLPRPLAIGVGLASMRERAAELGGRLTAESLPGGGTAVRALLPLIQPEAI